MPDFRVFELEERHFALAYPLARSAAGVSLPRWQAYARQVTLQGGGVLGVESQDDCFYGLAAFRTQETLRHGPALSVDVLAAIDLSSDRPVRSVLCTRLDEIARERGLDSIILTLRPGRVSAGWNGCELAADTIGYLRSLAGPSARPNR
ncbi:hypothetical protein GCM10011515_20050 [Tsuneonella deserti]|uniref:Uncharacterized protein n=2 Tax=Tsuneonella deserti TaxID=2035528 RepID=A0ABQ1SBP4_9SPHN|nr:hypothetical protein GCM10011515_20050 [Tsuneonella deserti]